MFKRYCKINDANPVNIYFLSRYIRYLQQESPQFISSEKKSQICFGWISRTLKNSHSETPKEFRSLLRKPKAVKALSKLGVDPQNALDNGILASRFSLSWFSRGFLDGGFSFFLNFIPTWGNDPIWHNLTNIFQMGWNHQPVLGWFVKWHRFFVYLCRVCMFFWRCYLYR